MGSSVIVDTIRQIKDSQPAIINLITNEGLEVRLKCIFKESSAPHFFLVFPPETLPGTIDTEKVCPVSVKTDSSSITLNAEIVEVIGNRTLELMAKKTVDPTSLREFFRVDYRSTVFATYMPGPNEDKSHYWNMQGETLDLSGSGLLAIFPEAPANKHRIELEIRLDTMQRPIECVAHIIRTRRLRKGRFQVALHFDSISHKDRDAIISNCLQEQRKQLREKIQTA